MTEIKIDYALYEDYLRLLKDSVKTKEQRAEINRRYYNRTMRECPDSEAEIRKQKRREYSRQYYQKNKARILARKREKQLSTTLALIPTTI